MKTINSTIPSEARKLPSCHRNDYNDPNFKTGCNHSVDVSLDILLKCHGLEKSTTVYKYCCVLIYSQQNLLRTLKTITMVEETQRFVD